MAGKISMFGDILSIHNDPACVLIGSSTHNERVERLWRDVYRDVTSFFVATFKALESEQMLDPVNEVDIFCLHYIFIPCVNQCLHDFQGAWNNHALSTEGNMTPLQLFVEGSRVNHSEDEAQQTSSTPPALIPVPEETECVQIPSNKFEPCNYLSTLLQSSVNPLTQSDDFGKSLYCEAMHKIGQHLQARCSECHLD